MRRWASEPVMLWDKRPGNSEAVELDGNVTLRSGVVRQDHFGQKVIGAVSDTVG